MNILPHWLDFDNYSYSYSCDEAVAIFNYFSNKLKINAIKNNKLIYDYTSHDANRFVLSDAVTHDTDLALSEIKNYIDSIANELNVQKINAFSGSYKNIQFPYNIYIGTDTAFYVSYGFHKGEAWFSMQISSTDYEKVKFVHNAYQNKIDRSESSPQIFAIVDSMRGPELMSIGKPSTPVIRENYSAKALELYDAAINNYKTDNPFGRLTILYGRPGTGKTYLLRGMMHDLGGYNATFMMLSPDILQRYPASTLIKLFLQAGPQNERVYVFCEDADSCMVTRNSDNASTISLLLNFADGIVGNLLNLRIIMTTNAEKIDIDNALLRPGRLNKCIEVGLLTADEANRSYAKLTGKNGTFLDQICLAEIYERIQSSGIVIEQANSPTSHRKIGFALSDSQPVYKFE